LSKLADEFGGKTIHEILEIFVKVSGDLQAVRDYLEGKRVIEWTSLEDIALSMPENSTEYRCLVATKGKDEIEKRKKFLINTS